MESVFRTPSHTCSGDTAAAGLLNMRDINIRSRVLLTRIHLTSIYTTPCCARKQNDQLQRPRCTAEGFWCVRLCLRSWTLDSGPTDETFLNSGSPELLARNTWDLYVRVLCCADLPLSCTVH